MLASLVLESLEKEEEDEEDDAVVCNGTSTRDKPNGEPSCCQQTYIMYKLILVVLLHWFCLQTQNRHLQQIPTLTK
jgi:hypothetical protein